jgi:arylsulfatase A-like enzyme
MVDSLRFDVIQSIEPREKGFMSLKGLRDQIETPAFDQLAENGASIPRLHAPFAATPPSTASVLTGQYPREHGVCGFYRPLNEDAMTLPDQFRDAGYHTVLFNGVDVFSIDGIGDRFDEYVYGSIRDMTRLIEEKNRQNTPVFVFFHTMDVHRPYFLSRYPKSPSDHQFVIEFLKEWSDRIDAPVPENVRDSARRTDEKLARYEAMNTTAWDAMLEFHYHFKEGNLELDDPVSVLSNLYLKGVEWFDKTQLSHYVDFVEGRDDTLTILSGDHGEASIMLEGEPTFYHGGKPFQDLVRVPGIVSGPEVESGEFEDWSLTSLVDLAPTIFSKMEVDVDLESISGQDLTQRPPKSRRVYSEFSQHLSDQDFPRDTFLYWHAVIHSDGYKYYRVALPMTDRDYELSLERFLEVAVRKHCVSVPGQEMVDEWISRAQKSDNERAVKGDFVDDLTERCDTENPELYQWQSDHFEQENLLISGDESHRQRADELDDVLCDRFPDPAEVAWEQEDVDVSREREEEVTEGLKGLGYL